MSEHLEKGKRALQHAAEMDVLPGDEKIPNAYTDLLTLARVQAEMAQADALERLAIAMEHWVRGNQLPDTNKERYETRTARS